MWFEAADKTTIKFIFYPKILKNKNQHIQADFWVGEFLYTAG